ncbi:ATP-binding protein [Desmospora activa]|nr:ATP-binding protein [Desmospora activa]
MIPDDFKECNLEDYVQQTPMQKAMFDHVVSYLEEFDLIRDSKINSLGFIAKYGETRIKEMRVSKHDPKYNSFGLGKTHLKIGAAKWLIDKGHSVMIVKDVALMDDLMNARMMDDGGEEYNRILSRVLNAPVLVWDDLGKSNPTQAKERLYFHIFNERSQARRPIVYSSNEDMETLSDRIGGAAVSRLVGMSGKYLMATVGNDYRIKAVS